MGESYSSGLHWRSLVRCRLCTSNVLRFPTWILSEFKCTICFASLSHWGNPLFERMTVPATAVWNIADRVDFYLQLKRQDHTIEQGFQTQIAPRAALWRWHSNGGTWALLQQQSFLKCFRYPIRVPGIENRFPRIRENHHRVPRIRENRVPRIREIGSLQVHTRHLTFPLKKHCSRNSFYILFPAKGALSYRQIISSCLYVHLKGTR